MLRKALLSLVAASAAQNGCETAGDCNTCLGGSAGSTCGWCAVNTTSSTAVGPQCVDLHSVFSCNIQFQTDKCSNGWKCQNHTNGPTCVPAVGGIADKQTCEQSCAHPPPHPKPSPPSPPKPKQAFKCDIASKTCSAAPFGDPTMDECKAHCKTAYQCNNATNQCMPVSPNATGHKWYDPQECQQHCPLTPQPVPYEMRGIWRGLAIQNSYAPGEWLAHITNASVSIWMPGASGYQLYLKGAATAMGVGGKQVILVHSSAGKLTGDVRLLAGDYSMNPEVKGFLQIAVDERHASQEVVSFDTAMAGATVLSFETCPAGGTPAPPSPPAPPTPCKAKLDVVVVIDGSASISSSNWQKLLTFVNQIVGGFQIAADQVEMGIVQFSATAQTVIGLSPDQAAITSAVTNLRQMKLNTNTYAGFKQAKDIIDSQGRPKTNGKIVIVLTDGIQNEGPPAKQVTDQLKSQEHAEIFGIGVGSAVDKREIESWCTAPLSDHYFAVKDYPDLQKVLDTIIANACKHPPPPPAPFAAPPPPALHAAPTNASQNCKFHLPANLPQQFLVEDVPPLADGVEAEAAEAGAEVEAVAAGAPLADACNAFDSCDKCIGEHVAGQTCGWCQGDVSYPGSTTPSSAHCAGASKFTCSGRYQTTTCVIPGGCGLKGTYRGLRIDNEYTFGEYQAQFQAYNTSEQVTLTQLDSSGKAASTVQGKLVCDAKCELGRNDTGVNFTITTNAGQILHGKCGFVHQVQAETDGLMWALSDPGVGTPPKGFDEAMLNTSKSEVFTYYKCSEYKKQTCAFKAV